MGEERKADSRIERVTDKTDNGEEEMEMEREREGGREGGREAVGQRRSELTEKLRANEPTLTLRALWALTSQPSREPIRRRQPAHLLSQAPPLPLTP